MNELSQIELKSTLTVPRYAVRLKPTDIPIAAWDDSPKVCVSINEKWMAHVIGLLNALDQPDVWKGDETEVYNARQQVNEIILEFMSMCEDCDIEFRIEDCELQYRTEADGEWIPIGNICGADGVDGADGADGANGTDGEDGEDGAPGAPGADGTDCDCDDFTHVPTPDNPPDTSDEDTACNIAAGIAEYLRAKTIQTKEITENTASILLAIEALAAAIAAAIFTGGAAWPLIVAAAALLVNAVMAAEGVEYDAMTADDTFWGQMACSIFCVIKPNKDITPELQVEMGQAIRETDYTSVDYDAPFWYDTIATFFEQIPNEIIRSHASVGATISYDCSDCDCPSDGCDISDWVLYDAEAGVINTGTRTSTFIEIAAYQRGDGKYYVIFLSPSSSNCCEVEHSTGAEESQIDAIVGSANLAYYNPCGDPPTNIVLGTYPMGIGTYNLNAFLFRDDNPFTLQWDTTS